MGEGGSDCIKTGGVVPVGYKWGMGSSCIKTREG